MIFLYISCLFFILPAANLAANSTKPNIVFVFVDDWGYSDVGFRNPAVLTPNFDDMVKNGLLLDRHYVFKYCSPSRASLLTGRWPHHAHQWNILNGGALVGANINMTMLPAKLKTAGYKTHMVGKWHLGFFEPGYLPINRGFDTSSGFLNGGEDHITAKYQCAVDFWKNNAPDPRNGTYDAYSYRDDLTDILKAHDTKDPFFLYLPLHNVHSPYEAPEEWLNKYATNSTCKFRRTYQAMVSVADNVTGLVVEMLKEKGMWDNTIMVVSADNGGEVCGGSNYPLKGSKKTFYEGGVRSLAFASGGLIPDKMKGKSTSGFIHVADWYPTFCKLAGVDSSDSGTGKFPVDGMDVWPIITGETNKTLHEEIILGYNFTRFTQNPEQGAIIVGNYKLIVGHQKYICDSDMWSPIDYPCTQGPQGDDCDPYCLFDIMEDPREKNNLAKTETKLLKEMLDRYNKIGDEPRDMQDQGYHTEESLPIDKNACKYMTEKGSYWQPFRNV